MLFLIPICRRYLAVSLCCTTIPRVFRLKIRNWVLRQLHRPGMLPAIKLNFIWSWDGKILQTKSVCDKSAASTILIGVE